MNDQARILTWCRWALIALTIGFCVIIAAHFKSSDYFFLFIGPRHFGFRIALEIIIGLWITLMCFDASVRPKKNSILYTLIALLVLTAISSAVGPNPDKSFFSNFERMEGWIGFLHWSAFAVLLGSIVHTLKEWAIVFLSTSIGWVYLIGVGYIQKIFALHAADGSFSGLHGFIRGLARVFGVQSDQVQGITDQAQRIEVWNQAIEQYYTLSKSSTRIEGFAGNAAYFSTLALAAFFALLFAVVWWYSQAHRRVAEKTAKPEAAFRKAWAWVGLGTVYALFILGAFYWSETRGAVLALGFSIIVAAIITLCHKGIARWLHYVAGAGLAVVLLVVGLLCWLRDTAFVLENATLARYAALVSEPLLVNWGIVAVLALVAVFHYKTPKKIKYAAGTLLAAIILVFGGLFALRNTAFVSENPTLARYGNVFTNSFCNDVSQSRCKIWPIGVKGIAERPIGYGYEGYSYAFFKHSTPDLYRYEAWFDRAHNIFLDWGIYGGVLGFLLFIAIFVWSLWYIWKPHAKIGGQPLPVEIKLVVTASLIAYAVQGLFLFDNFFSYVWLYMTVGFCIAVASDPYKKGALPQIVQAGKARTAFMIGAAIAWVVIIWGGLIVLNGRSMTINKEIIQFHREANRVQAAIQQSRLDIAEASMKYIANQAMSARIAQSPYRFEYRSQLFQVAPRLLQYGQVPQLSDEAIAILNAANAHAEMQLREQPRDVYMMYHVIVYAMASNQAEVGLAIAKEALAINPTKQIILSAASDLAFQSGDLATAQSYVARLASSTPADDPMTSVLLSYLAGAEGNIAAIPRIFASEYASQPRYHQYIMINAVRFNQTAFLRAYIAELKRRPELLAAINQAVPNLISESEKLINSGR